MVHFRLLRRYSCRNTDPIDRIDNPTDGIGVPIDRISEPIDSVGVPIDGIADAIDRIGVRMDSDADLMGRIGIAENGVMGGGLACASAQSD